jgi:hypothetical protein
MKKYLKIFLVAFISSTLFPHCKEDRHTEENFKIEDYYGKYSGTLIVDAMAENGWIIWDKLVTRKIATEIILSPIKQTTNGVMVYVSAFHDSIHTKYNPETKYLVITDKPYSFYLRLEDFPKFDGIYDHAVTTYGRFAKWDNEDVLRLGISFIKNLNDSLFICGTIAKKID